MTVPIMLSLLCSADLLDFVGLTLFLEEKLNCKVDVVPQDDIRREIKDSILQETMYI